MRKTDQKQAAGPPSRKDGIKVIKPPTRSLGLGGRIFIILFLLVGMAMFYKLALRIHRRHTGPPKKASPSPSVRPPVRPSGEAPIPVLPSVTAIREAPDSEPSKAFLAAALILEFTPDIMKADQAVFELETRLEAFDRQKVYQAIDQLVKDAKSDRGKQSAAYLEALVASQIFLHERHDPKRAEQLLTGISNDKASPLAPLAIHRLATLRVADDPRQAIRLFKEQIQVFPDHPLNGQASFLIGTCHRVLEEDHKALEQYTETLRKYPKSQGQGGGALDPYVRHAMADVYIRLSLKEDARKELEHIKISSPDYPYQSVVEEMLKTLP